MAQPFDPDDQSKGRKGPSKASLDLAAQFAKPNAKERDFFRVRKEKGLGVGLDETDALRNASRENSEHQRDLGKTGVRVFHKIADAWRLSETERMTILDVNDLRTYQGLMADEPQVSSDLLDRLSYCLGIYKALHTIFSESTAANSWLRRPNKAIPFEGRSALEYILENNTTGLSEVRQYLDAQCN
ncbi:MbcA/ParS/Xre antitoxin family protein [Sphingomicrobium sp. XHP0235]|uniref:MbcA/ParS/Xre antitoxin family protein n=1 Tax=Sphingomicrobium aquimarinum TaxID=3133971 RepID=UPI0031FE4D1F